MVLKGLQSQRHPVCEKLQAQIAAEVPSSSPVGGDEVESHRGEPRVRAARNLTRCNPVKPSLLPRGQKRQVFQAQEQENLCHSPLGELQEQAQPCSAGTGSSPGRALSAAPGSSPAATRLHAQWDEQQPRVTLPHSHRCWGAPCPSPPEPSQSLLGRPQPTGFVPRRFP